MSTTTVSGLLALGGGRGQRLDIGRMVDHDHHVLGLLVERDQPRDRLRRHHRRGDVQALDAALGQRLGLAQLGAAHAERARMRSGAWRCRPTCGSWNAAAGSPCAPSRRLAISAMLRSSISRSSTSAGVFSDRREPCWPMRCPWRRCASKSLLNSSSLRFSRFEMAHDHGLAGRAAIDAGALHEGVVAGRCPTAQCPGPAGRRRP